jgi:ATP-binding cassette subfamily F protein 3
MIILSCYHIYKSFGIDSILEDISFTVDKGEKIGLIGTNGAGKSTLFKILTGQYPYDKGELYWSKDVNIGYLEQNASFESNQTVLDEVLHVFDPLIRMESELRKLEQQITKESLLPSSKNLESLMESYAHQSEVFQKKNGYGYQSEIRGVLKGLGFSDEEFQQPLCQLSGGQKTRLGLAKLLLSKPDLLLLDEPTNHLDIDAIEWLETFLKSYDGTILLISHDRYFLDEIVNKIYEIDNRQMTQYNGNYTSFVKKKKMRYEQQRNEYLQQQKEIEKQEDMIRRFKQHGTEKLAKRAKSREKRLEKLSPIERPIQVMKNAKIRFETQIKSGKDILQIENLSKTFDHRPLFHHIAFSIHHGEKIGLIGPNGIGKSTLFKIILGLIPYDTGSIQLGHNVYPGYYDQEQSDLNLSNTVMDEIWNQNIRFTETEVRTLLGSFLFTGDDVFKPISTLSGGEKSRLALLKLMLSKANFLLMDEPTNHLDIPSKEALEDALINYEGTLLIISHDRYFLNKVTTKTLELSAESIQEFLGNYKYYVEKKKEWKELQNTETKIIKTKTQQKEEKRKEKEKIKEERQFKKEREAIETKIFTIEEKIKAIEKKMCTEEVYANPEKSKQAHKEMDTLQTELETLYAQWENYIE